MIMQLILVGQIMPQVGAARLFCDGSFLGYGSQGSPHFQWTVGNWPNWTCSPRTFVMWHHQNFWSRQVGALFCHFGPRCSSCIFWVHKPSSGQIAELRYTWYGQLDWSFVVCGHQVYYMNMLIYVTEALPGRDFCLGSER